MSESLPPFDPAPSFGLTESPDPGWQLGDGIRDASPLARAWKDDAQLGWKTFNFDEDKSNIYKLLTSTVTPRPIAFVSTLSADGIPNLAPFSYFSLISHNPPLISVAFSLSPRRPKDTRENIKATKEFVVNIISEPFVEAANACSIESPADNDEWLVSGLTPEKSELVKPPRARESAVSFECELFHFLDIAPSGVLPPSPPTDVGTGTGTPQPTTSVAIGLIRRAHVRRAVLDAEDEGRVDPARLRAVSRLGGTTYARVGGAFDIARPKWKDVESRAAGLLAKK